MNALDLLERDLHEQRTRSAAPEMERCLRSMVADHSVAECWSSEGPCWPHRILDRIDRPDPALNDADGGRRSD